MGNINDKLEYMNGTKLDIRDALIEQNQEVPPSTPFRAYGDIIRGLDTTDTSDATATSDDILNGKTAYVNKEKLIGTMVDNGELNYTPSTSSQSIPAGYTSGGTIAGVDSSIDNNIQSYNIKEGVNILGVEGNVKPDKPDQTKTVNPSTSIQEVTADTGYELAKVTINPVTASIDNNITSNNIKSGVSILGVNGNVVELNGQTKTVTPSTSQQVITPDQNYNALTEVTINAVPDETSVLNAQDTLLATQEIKISDLEEALNNKIALDLTNATSDANATASDIKQGKSAYVNGQKIEGTIPHFANRDMTSLNSMLEYEIRSFVNYLDEQYEQQTPYLNEPITIYAPDENMKYFVISKTTDNQFRILWSATKFGNLQHKTTTENKVNFYKKMASKTTNNSFLINSIEWEYSNYGNGTFNNFIELNRAYSSSRYSTLEDLISAISNPNSSITYSHPNNEPSFSCTPNFNNITNMFFWENKEIGDGKSMNTFVTHRKLSNNITILPLE